MLVASLGSPCNSTPRRRRSPTHRLARSRIGALHPTAKPAIATAFLIVWCAIGVGLVLCVPAARGSSLFGATLPFWLVAAPLLDLGWLKRASLRRLLREQSTRMRRRRALIRQ